MMVVTVTRARGRTMMVTTCQLDTARVRSEPENETVSGTVRRHICLIFHVETRDGDELEPHSASRARLHRTHRI